jgi:hypothetical protein
MEQINPQTFESLVSVANTPCLTIYLPTFKSGNDAQQNPIRFRNLVKKSKDLLSTSQHTTHSLKVAVDNAAKLIDDPEFWQHQNNGLAIFINPNQTSIFRLPLRFSESVTVNRHFELKPLLPLITTNGKFFILTISQKDIKLYEATRTDIGKRFLGDIPRNMSEVFDFDNLEKNLQVHSGSRNKGGSGTAVFGQNSGEETYKKDMEQFLMRVETGITNLLKPEASPLILAGVEYLTTMFKKVNHYPQLLDQTIDGSPDKSTKEKLHKAAWKIIRPLFKQGEKDALDTFYQLVGTGKASSNISEILPAAYQGRVQTLFVSRDQTLWGKYNLDSVVMIDKERDSDSLDLYDLATIYTLRNSGRVYSLKPKEMVKGAEVAATYRY